MSIGRKIMNFSAPGGTRTHGTLLRRQMLYPLSYGRSQERSFLILPTSS